MKWTVIFILLVPLLSCSKVAIDPIGKYTLNTGGSILMLEIHAGGEYFLKVAEMNNFHSEIKGHWEKEDGPGPSISLHGIIWHGTEAQVGHGIWAATIDSDSKICLDAEGLNCFVKSK